jgi:hypothetical protein
MKVKALKNTKRDEFIHLEDEFVYTSSLPDLRPETATKELLIDYYKSHQVNIFSDILNDKDVEMVELDIIESGVVGADIRNKLSPIKNLISMLESDENLNELDLYKHVLKEIKQSKISIDYLKNLL